MNNYEILALTFIEISSLMIIFSIFNKNEENLIIKNFTISLIISIFVFLSNIFFINVGNFLYYIVAFILILIIYKNNFYETILQFCISLITIAILELFFTILLKVILTSNNLYTFKNGIIINSLLLGTSLIAYHKLPIKIQLGLHKSIIEHHTFKVLILNCIIYIICFKLLWEYDKGLVLNHIVIFILIFLSFNIAIFVMFRQIIKLTEEKNSIKLSSMYSHFVEEMVSEIKRKQHEFKNHINAIYGICYTTDDKFIKKNIIEYLKSVNYSMITIDELINTNNKILAAVIYSKICEAKHKNIKLLYSIKSNLHDIKLKKYELVEILSDIINNAFEYIELNDINEKVVYVKIGRDKGKNFIEVANYYVYKDNINTNLIFKKGFSTKGESRGYGLYNIKKIVETNGGKIQVFFRNNYIVFKILF